MCGEDPPVRKVDRMENIPLAKGRGIQKMGDCSRMQNKLQ
jgi:hypothetical protein